MRGSAFVRYRGVSVAMLFATKSRLVWFSPAKSYEWSLLVGTWLGSDQKVLPVNKTAPLGTRCLGGAPTVLRIESVNEGRSVVLKLSGRIDEEHLAQLHAEIEKSGDVSKLDLKDVNLVDRSSVRFLMQCESRGIQLAHCPLYIQEWISRERGPSGFASRQ